MALSRSKYGSARRLRESPDFGVVFFLFFVFSLQQSGAQHLHRLDAVLQLTAFVLHCHDHAGRFVRDQACVSPRELARACVAHAVTSKVLTMQSIEAVVLLVTRSSSPACITIF